MSILEFRIQRLLHLLLKRPEVQQGLDLSQFLLDGFVCRQQSDAVLGLGKAVLQIMDQILIDLLTEVPGAFQLQMVLGLLVGLLQDSLSLAAACLLRQDSVCFSIVGIAG